MKRKFLFISSAPFEGGAEKSLLTYLSGSRASGHVLIVHTNTILSAEIQAVHHIYRLPFAWFVKTNNPLLYLYFIWNWIYCSFRIFLISKKHGISVVFSNTFKTYLFTLLAKLLIRLKLIICLRDNITASWQKELLAISDQVITISNHIQAQLYQNTTSEIIYPCISLKPSLPVFKDPFVKKKPAQLTIVTVGQVVPWKGQLLFLNLAETFKSNDQIQFRIIGDDQSNSNKVYRDVVVQRAESLKNVEFLGHVEQMNLLMPKIDIMVHLAEDEPFGRVIVEAMLAEKPVIALKSGGIPEIIDHDKSGLLVEKELALFQSRNAINSLLKSPSKRLSIGREARKRALMFTDMDKHILQIDHLLNTVNAR